MKVVLDTMLWVSYCTLKDGYRYRLIERARSKRVRFFVSEYILNELELALTEDLGLTTRFAALARRAVLRFAKSVELSSTPRSFVPGDPDDDPIVQTALKGKVDYLVTADKEILKVGKIEDVQVLSTQQWEKELPLT
ncbi:MAG: putative toxin-antitoxin system toxin component, PIN family [Planctomycetes bacterium]|nr:putative toxin-antitoxin system toxin component, PIN family [Planctomycetota bacterium]